MSVPRKKRVETKEPFFFLVFLKKCDPEACCAAQGPGADSGDQGRCLTESEP